MRQAQFINNSNIPAALIRAVSKQMGGWDSFTDHAEDIANHGAASGWGGFTYYSDTVMFFRENRKTILEVATNLADDLGESMLAMIAGFNCLKGYELTQDDVAKALYTGKGEDATCIMNAMTWFALEEVARAYCDCLENAAQAA